MRSRSASIAQGRVAKAAGDAAEAFWDAQHEAAKWLGVLVHVQHNQPAVKHIHGRLIYAKKSAADFTGTMVDGKTFAAESKSVDGRLMCSAVKPLQVAQLDAVAKASGAAYLLAEFREGVHKERFAIPWLSVPWRKLRSAESIGVEDMKADWKIMPGECYLHRGVQVPVGVGGRKRVYPRE